MAAYTGRPGVDWGAVAQAVAMEKAIQDWQEDQRSQAIRWQGQQDYQTLVQSGIAPVDALSRTAPKLFYNDPRGLASAVDSIRSSAEGVGEPITRDIGGGRTALWTGRSWRLVPQTQAERGSFVKYRTTDPETGLTITEDVPIKEHFRRQASNAPAPEMEINVPKFISGFASDLGLTKPTPTAPGPSVPRPAIGGSLPIVSPLVGEPTTAAPINIQKPAPTAITGPTTVQRMVAPPLESREKGQVYPTPRGPATWDGKQWIPVEQPTNKFSTMPSTIQWGVSGIRG